MRREHFGAIALLLLLTGGGCSDGDCPPNTVVPMRLEITILEELSGVRPCGSGTASAGDSLLIATTTVLYPLDNGACTGASAALGRPQVDGRLYGVDVSSCSPVAGLGTRCKGTQEECSGDTLVEINLDIAEPSEVGAEVEGTYQVHMGYSSDDPCFSRACVDEFRVRVKRLN